MKLGLAPSFGHLDEIFSLVWWASNQLPKLRLRWSNWQIVGTKKIISELTLLIQHRKYILKKIKHNSKVDKLVCQTFIKQFSLENNSPAGKVVLPAWPTHLVIWQMVARQTKLDTSAGQEFFFLLRAGWYLSLQASPSTLNNYSQLYKSVVKYILIVFIHLKGYIC